MSRLSFGLVCATLVLAQHGARADVSLLLKHDATISGATVLLADLATVGGSGAPAGIKDIVIGAAPRPGLVEPVARAEIERALRRAAVRGPLRWYGAEVVAVRAATQLVPGAALGAAAVAEFGRRLRDRYPDGTVRLAGVVDDAAIRPGVFRLAVRKGRARRLQARELAWVDIVQASAVERSVAVPLEVSVPAVAAFAAHDIAVGTQLAAADVEMRELDLVQARGAPLGPGELSGLRAARPIRAGELLTAQLVAAQGSVLRGDAVRVATASGAVRVEMQGVALGSAARGRHVMVRTAGGSALDGRVVNDGLVVIE